MTYVIFIGFLCAAVATPAISGLVRKKPLLVTLRMTCQAFFLVLFIFLLTQTVIPVEGHRALGGHFRVDFFLHLSPLLAISAMIAGRVFIAGMLMGLVILVGAVVAGRFFCGWVCPLGTVFDVFDRLLFRKLKRPESRDRVLRKLKFFLLTAILVTAVFGVQSAGWFDPIAIATRSFSVALLPAADRAAKAAIEKPLRDKAFRDASPRPAGRLRRTDETLKSLHILYDRDPSYLQTGLVGELFAMLVLLQIYQRRFWCRKVCPLGALFGLAGMKRPLGVYLDSARCTDCGRCRLVCPTGAIQGKAVSPEECIFCGLCVDVCPADALGVHLRAPEAPAPAPPPKVVPGRREFLVAAVAGAAAWPVLAADRAAHAGRGSLIRPPGAQDEERFLDACIRCGECMKACPENALQPAGIEEGLAGLWTPRIVPVMGYCDYYCLPDDSPVGNFCATVCPTGAIMKLTPKEKHETRIATASIRTDLCIPYVEDIECGVCVEHCPVKAIKNEFVEVRDHETGGTRTIQRPRVDRGLCIGCGECEHVCPLEGMRGIYVKPAAASHRRRRRRRNSHA